MIPGGIADKLGNRYEAKWVVLKLIDVVRGDASALHFEGTSEAFAGFEFSFTKGTTTQWHQVKIFTTGNWTLNRLRAAHVLDAFKRRFLGGDVSDTCHFISQDAAVELRELAQRARIANAMDDFEQSLSEALTEDFRELARLWGVERSTALGWLKRVYVRTESEVGLEEAIEAYGQLCFSADSRQIFSTLRDYMENRFNKVLTTDIVRRELPEVGIALKHWELDATIGEKLSSSTADYLISYPPLAEEHAVRRREADQILAELSNQDGPRVILLTGVAGSGKSGVVKQLIDELRAKAIIHLSFRADEFLDVGTNQEIGKRLTGRKESPVVTLKGMSKSAPSVVIIDQVDAVSEVSGRDPRLKPLILRLISDAGRFETVRVVCVCRAFDLENDRRLKQLTAENFVRRIQVALLDWSADIQPLLQSRGIDVARLSNSQRKLLELPLNLTMFLQTQDDGESFASRNDLFRRLLQVKSRDIERKRGPVWSVTQPLYALAKWMSERQVLHAPLSRLDAFPSASDILASEHLITHRNGKVHLFHESFFDYLFARGFVNESQTLVELLLSDDDQHLFRRTQIRQILESLREDDWSRYLSELGAVLTHADVRYHVKAAVAQWLGSLSDPSPEELAILLRLMNTAEERLPPLVRYAVYGTPGWFDVTSAIGNLIECEMNSLIEARREDALWWLSRIASQRAEEVTKLLEKWCRTDDAGRRAERLADWFTLLRGQPIGGRLLGLCRTLVETNPQFFWGKKNHHRLSALFDSIAGEDVTEVAPLIEACFRNWFEAHLEGHPFATCEEELDMEPLQKIAARSPRALVVATTQALLTTIQRIAEATESSGYDFTFRRRKVGEQYHADEKFLTIFRESLKSLAASEPKFVEECLSRLTASAHPALLHLHLEAIAAGGANLAHRLPALLGEERLFEAGWADVPYQSFADAARAALPHLNVEQQALIEQKVIGYRPELRFVADNLTEISKNGEDSHFRSKALVVSVLKQSGREEWGVWESIGGDLLSANARRRLALLRRKFPGKVPRSPQGIQAGFVGSPIPPSAIARMSDKHWLNAISGYANKERRRQRQHPLEGGAEQLAGQLLQLTKENPARFAALAEKIPECAAQSYIRNILYGLGESTAAGLEAVITRATLSAHRRPGRPFGAEISYVLDKHPELAADDAVFDALRWYAEFGTHSQRAFDQSEQRTEQPFSIEQLLSRGDHIYTSALDGQRGSTVDALARILWKLPRRNKETWAFAKSRISDERELSVRCVLVHLLMPLFNDDKFLCADLLERLASAPDNEKDDGAAENLVVLTTRVATHFLPYVIREVPDVGERLIELMLSSHDNSVRAIGAWHVISASFYGDRFIEKADKLIAGSEDFKLLAADCASETVVNGVLTDRALTAITQYLDDPDKLLRDKASEVFRNIPPENFARAASLAHKYIDSSAFGDQSFAFFQALEKATCDVSELVVASAEKLVNVVAASNSAHQRATDLHQLRELLKREYVSTEHSPALRKRILDVLDVMLAHEIYGADEVLKAHERD